MSQAAENMGVAPRQVGKYLAEAAIVFAAYLIAGKLGQATTAIRSGNLGPVWPAYGIALAAILVCGYRVWFGIAVAAFLVAFLSPVPFMAAVGQAAGATLAALLGAFLLRTVKFRPSLSRLRDALALIVLGAFGSATVSATIGVSVLYATHLQAYSGLSSAWLIYWLGDATGVLLVAPLVMTAPDLLRIRSRARIREFVELLLLLTATCFIVFGDLPLIPVKLHVLAFAVLPFVMWAAIRFGVSGGALSTLLVAAIATVETALGSGPFALNAPFTNAVLLDVFFAVLSVSGMTLAAVIAEREQGEREREQLVRKQAAMEARLRLATIVESSDDAIIGEDIDGIVTDWNRGAEQLYGYSANEVIGRPISFLIPQDRSNDFPEIVRKLKRGEAVKHHETLWQRKDGTNLEVSLTASPIVDSEGRTIGVSAIARDITERNRAEEALRESEDKLRLLLDSTAEAIFGIDLQDRCTFCNPACLRALGYERVDELLGQNMHDLIHHSRADGTLIPLEECRIFGALRAGKGAHIDDEVLWKKNGKSFPAEYWAYPQRKGQEIVGAVVTFTDITESKLVEAALASVSRRLIEAQEQERSRIARELHDDIGQRLALLAAELEQIHQNSPDLRPEVRSHTGDLWKRSIEIATDIQSLSHELHSSKLQYLGIAAAMRGFCKEFGEQQNVQIAFETRDLPSPLPPDTSLCLFRVLQEALHNSAKHSGVRHFEVRLWGASGEIHLTVSDSGAGFDCEVPREARGLGLISMEERLKALNGTFSIESQPQRGTTIHARVPLRSDSRPMCTSEQEPPAS
jgi:PAS domain S-box-containing protein